MGELLDTHEHIGVAVEQALLGVDPGDQRVGVAVKVAGEVSPEALKVLPNNNALWEELAALVAKYHCEAVIVGLPRNVDGNDTAQTRKAREFAGELADRTDLHVLMHDEFSTSQRARERLNRRHKHVTRELEKRELDALAAAILLEDYLESLV